MDITTIRSFMEIKTIKIDTYQKQKSFDLIKIVMSQYVDTLEILITQNEQEDLFMKTTKNLISSFNYEMSEIIEKDNKEYYFSEKKLNIIKDALDFYWSNSKALYQDYNETDYINARNMLNQHHKSFVKI